MNSFLSSRNTVLTSAASSWYGIVSAQPGPPAWPYTQLTASYPSAAFTMPVDAMASGLKPFTPSGIEKRQGACTLAPSGTDSGASSTAIPSESEIDSGASSSLAAPATTLTNLPTLTTGILTPSGSSCVSTVTQTECVAGSGGTSACVTTPACGSWTATVASTLSSETSSSPSPTTATVSMAIYKDNDCTDLIDEFDISLATNCGTHLKENGDTQHFRCFIVKDVVPVDSSTELELIVYKNGHCPSGKDDKSETFTNLGALVNKGQTPFKMGSLILKAAGT